MNNNHIAVIKPMAARNCPFCDIANGEMHSYKIYEDEKHLASIDIFSNIGGRL